nr:hypothetical protein [Tanacetum cinerariifolium]
MSTRSSARNLFPPLDNPELTIQIRYRADPTLLNDFEMDAEGNDDLPVPDIRSMEELCQPSLNGRSGPIAPITIQATKFGLKNDIIQQVQNSCQFHGLSGDDANKHLDKFLYVTQSIKVNGVIDEALRLYLFPHSLTHHVTTWFDRLPRNLINIFDQMAKIFLGKYFPPSMVTKLRNEVTNFRQHTFYNGLTLRHRDTINAAAALKAKMAEINKNLIRVLQVNQQVKAVTPNCETCGGPHSFTDCPAIVGQTQNVYAAGAYQDNTITNPKEELKGITTRSGNEYQGPMIPTTFSSPPVVERETEATKDTMHPTNNRSTKDVQPLVVQTESLILNSKLIVASIIEPVIAPVSALKPNQRPLIPYPSILHDPKLRDKANDQREKIFQIFKDLDFNISFADALILIPKFGLTIKTLLKNKDKLSELARIPLNKHCSGALADLDASINLMPLSVWNKRLPDLSLTCMTLELADRLISRPVGVAEDVFVKVGTFHFPVDFVVVDFDADPRVRLILERSFLKTRRALIDVESDFLLEEVNAFLSLEDDSTSPKVNHCYVDTEGDILLLEAFLNEDPSLPPPNQGNYLPQVRKELKFYEAKTDKSLIDEPPKVELKDLPPHLEYTFLEGEDKLPVIIGKDLSVEEKIALITVLKSHKRAIAWKLSDTKGIDQEFCAHNILIEDDFEPAVQD